MMARPKRCDDMTIDPSDSSSGKDADVIIQTLRSLPEEERLTRVATASAGAGEP